jgi:hypothetical protein
MSLSPGTVAFRLFFQVSPIIFTNGIASFIPTGLPIILITQALTFAEGLFSGGEGLDVDDFFANFIPLPGSSLIEQTIGKYPFANQAVAANAVIRQPLNISMRMICPARDPSGYALKLATMTALQAAFASHNASGGTYTVATPSFLYTNCVMTAMKDTSNNASQQAQNTYQIDFEQPLLTLQDVQNAQNNLMGLISGALPTGSSPLWTAVAPTIGVPGATGLGTIPANTSLLGSQTAAPASIPSS